MESKVHFTPFTLVGISVRTTNKNGQAMHDIGQLWHRFYAEDILSKIQGRMSDEVYSVYTDYESDFTGPYTTLLGCKVNSPENIPDGFTAKVIEGGEYLRFKAEGKMPDAIVDTWQKIWADNQRLKRTYTADFEVYGAKSQNPDNAEVEIYIAV